MDCKQAKVYFDAYLDDELSAEKIIEIEEHLCRCSECAADVELSREVTRISQVAIEHEEMGDDFRARLLQSLSDERKLEETRSHFKPLSWRVIAPLTAAAAFILTLGVVQQNQTTADVEPPAASMSNEASIASATDSMMDYLVSRHSQSPTSTLSTSEESPGDLEQELGFPIREPQLENYGALFEGASIVSINGHRVASLRYLIAGRRVTFYVYNPDEMPLRANSRLKPQVVDNQAVFVGRYRGYSVAAIERAGVGYLVTADLSSQKSAEIVLALNSGR
jgi:anti-sigma factor RsiW